MDDLFLNQKTKKNIFENRIHEKIKLCEKINGSSG